MLRMNAYALGVIALLFANDRSGAAQDVSACLSEEMPPDTVGVVLRLAEEMRNTEARIFKEFQRLDCPLGCDHLEGLADDFHSSSRALYRLAYETWPEDPRVACSWGAVLMREAHISVGEYDPSALERALHVLGKARETPADPSVAKAIEALVLDVEELLSATKASRG